MTGTGTQHVASTDSDLNVLTEKGFILGRGIGEGSYAKVYRATYKAKEKSYELACKVIDTAKAPRDYLVKFLPREIDALLRLKHPHIVHTQSIFQRRSKYFIFLRFAESGDLLDFITEHGALSEKQTRIWTSQISLGLEYIHQMNMAHRDLKCENIIITKNYNVKITDFGFVRSCRRKGANLLSETYCGSLSYAAPEILKGQPYFPLSSDLWSLGVIIFAMLNKSLPFNETSVKKLYEKQVTRKWKFRTKYVDALSAEVKKLVTDLLDPDSEKRPQASAVARCPWVAMEEKFLHLTHAEATALTKAKEEHGRLEVIMEYESELEKLTALRRNNRGKDGIRMFKFESMVSYSSFKLTTNMMKLWYKAKGTLRILNKSSKDFHVSVPTNEVRHRQTTGDSYKQQRQTSKFDIL